MNTADVIAPRACKERHLNFFAAQRRKERENEKWRVGASHGWSNPELIADATPIFNYTRVNELFKLAEGRTKRGATEVVFSHRFWRTAAICIHHCLTMCVPLCDHN